MKSFKFVICVIWVAAFAILGVHFAFFAEKESVYDEDENRMLAAAPVFSRDKLLDGVSEEMESYLADHIMLRAQAIRLCERIKDLGSIATYEDSLAVLDNSVDELSTNEVDEAMLAAMAEEVLKPKPSPTPTPTFENAAEPVAATPTPSSEPESGGPLPLLPEKPAVVIADYPTTLRLLMNANGKSESLRSYWRAKVQAETAVLNRVAALLPEDGRLVFTMVPASAMGNEYLSEEDKAGFYCEAEPAVEAFGARNVLAVPAADVLGRALERGEYVYFRSDMHWTAAGAYLVYREMLTRAGLEPAAWEDYDITTESPFLGTYYRDSRSDYMAENPDTLELLQPRFALEWRRITGPDGAYEIKPFLDFDARENDRYTVYLGGPAGPWFYAQCDNGIERRCLVICDSFGLGFVPLLTQNYGQVHYCDPRYFDKNTTGASISELIASNGISDVYVVVGDLHAYNSDFVVYQLSTQLGDR